MEYVVLINWFLKYVHMLTAWLSRELNVMPSACNALSEASQTFLYDFKSVDSVLYFICQH